MQGKVDLKEFFSEMQKKQTEISDLVRRKMPVFAGRIAVNHVQDNFRKGGFTNDGLKPWKKSNRELHGGKGASSNYGTLLSQRDHLYGSAKYIPAMPMPLGCGIAPFHIFPGIQGFIGETLVLERLPEMVHRLGSEDVLYLLTSCELLYFFKPLRENPCKFFYIHFFCVKSLFLLKCFVYLHQIKCFL